MRRLVVVSSPDDFMYFGSILTNSILTLQPDDVVPGASEDPINDDISID